MRAFQRTAFAVVATLVTAAAWGQAFPSRPVKLGNEAGLKGD
jgi:hypothetical protein